MRTLQHWAHNCLFLNCTECRPFLPKHFGFCFAAIRWQLTFESFGLKHDPNRIQPINSCCVFSRRKGKCFQVHSNYNEGDCIMLQGKEESVFSKGSLLALGNVLRNTFVFSSLLLSGNNSKISRRCLPAPGGSAARLSAQ